MDRACFYLTSELYRIVCVSIPFCSLTCQCVAGVTLLFNSTCRRSKKKNLFPRKHSECKSNIIERNINKKILSFSLDSTRKESATVTAASIVSNCIWIRLCFRALLRLIICPFIHFQRFDYCGRRRGAAKLVLIQNIRYSQPTIETSSFD